jgi:hypothetical protein
LLTFSGFGLPPRPNASDDPPNAELLVLLVGVWPKMDPDCPKVDLKIIEMKMKCFLKKLDEKVQSTVTYLSHFSMTDNFSSLQ